MGIRLTFTFLLFSSLTFGQLREPDIFFDPSFPLDGVDLRSVDVAASNEEHLLVGSFSRQLVFDFEGKFIHSIDVEGTNGFSQNSDSDGFGDLAVVGMPKAGGFFGGQTLVFNTKTGEQLYHFGVNDEGPFGKSTRWGSSVAISDKYVAVGEEAAQAAVFDLETGEQTFTYYVEHETTGGFSDVDLMGDTLAVGSPGRIVDGQIRPAIMLFDLTTGENTLEIHDDVEGFAHNVALGQDRIFTQTATTLRAYDYDGDLLVEKDSRSLFQLTNPFALTSRPTLTNLEFDMDSGFVRVDNALLDENLDVVYFCGRFR